MNNNFGSEIIIPKLKSYRIIDLTKAINSKCKINITGIKQGEKLHEELITLNDTKILDIGPFTYSEDKLIIKKYRKNFLKVKINKISFITIKKMIFNSKSVKKTYKRF